MRSKPHHLHRSTAQFSGSDGLGFGAMPAKARAEWNLAVLDRTAALEREKREYSEQLFQAAQIERELSGPRVWRLGQLACAREVFCAAHLSGDFAVFWRKGGALIAAMGDIAGKGLAAGMWFTHLIGLLQHYTATEAGPAQVVAEMNRHFYALRPLAPFVTLFVAEIDSASGEIHYCNAGHFPPVLLRSRAQRETLETGGPLIGALADARYEAGRQRLDPGNCLLAYSDGIIECRGANGDEFGTARLIEHAARIKDEPPQAGVIELLGAVQDFAGGSAQCDDMSLMLVRRDGPAEIA